MNANDKKSSPVRVVFDNNSERIDIVSGKTLPAEIHALGGSIRFFEGRLDKLVENISYMFAPMVSLKINSLILIRKLTHPNIWALVSRRGDNVEGLHPVMAADVVKVYSVSFIPLNPASKQPEARVHVMLEDLYLVAFEHVDHWLATKSQSEYEAEQGTKY